MFALTGLLFVTVGAQRPLQRPAAREVVSHPHVYLMRGLMNIFSLGMDELAAKIERHGIAAGVYNHTQADAVVNEIVADYRAGDQGRSFWSAIRSAPMP